MLDTWLMYVAISGSCSRHGRSGYPGVARLGSFRINEQASLLAQRAWSGPLQSGDHRRRYERSAAQRWRQSPSVTGWQAILPAADQWLRLTAHTPRSRLRRGRNCAMI